MCERSQTVERTRRLAVAQAIAGEAGELALKYFRSRALQVSRKGPRDWVSEADLAVEELIRRRLAETVGGDDVLGEEGGSSVRGETGYRWVFDPIDGTARFISGLPDWSVSIACLDPDGRPLLGVVHDPLRGETFSAVAARALEVNGTIVTPRARRLEDGPVGVGYSPKSGHVHRTLGFIAALMEEGGSPMIPGSAALGLAHVAAGRLVGFYEASLRAWDCLAGEVLVTASGGWVTPFLADGRLEGSKEVVAANRAAADLIRSLWRSLDGEG